MTNYWRIPVSMTLRAPWITPGDAAAGPSTDIVLARNRQGQFILPASLIKGNLRAAADALVAENAIKADTRDICFGTPSATRAKGIPQHTWRVANEPERGALIFGDLVTDMQPQNPNGRTQRVAIDPELGAAREGHLLFIECPFSFGTPVKFCGEIIMWSNPKVTKDDAVALLKQSLGRIFAIGGMKSVGFGRVANFEIENPIAVEPAAAKAPGLRLAVEYCIDRPFIVDTERHSGNLLIGSDVILGAAIKAMLARGCKAAGIKADDFLSALNISHASPEGHKPLPLSLSITSDAIFCNLDGQTRPGFHKFQGDWKNAEKNVRKALGEGWERPEIRYSGRSRTAIDTASLTSRFEVGKDGHEGTGQLFSQMSIVPDGLIWCGTINAPDNPELLGQLLGLLKVGLPGLGKTGAILKGTAHATETTTPPTDTLNLTLTSDACLFKPQDASNADVGKLYRTYFETLGFDLVHFFARQVLKGGYVALRYPAIANKYIPWVLTGAGSVFRVKPTNGADIADILANGLPPAKGLSDDWREFPFLRENGFGHVVHNILDHKTLAEGINL